MRDKGLMPGYQLGNDEKLYPIVAEEASRRIGLLVIVIVFMIFGVWAIFAPLARAVIAPGVVKVELDRRSIQHLEGGIIKKVHVRDGDMVKQGDVLLTLEETQSRSDMEVTDSQIMALTFTQARLRTERDGREAIVFPREYDRKDQRVAQLADNEISLFRARSATHRSEMSVLRERVRQTESQIAGLKMVNQRKYEIRRSLENELADRKTLLERKFVSRHSLLQTERQLSEIEGEIAENDASIANQQVQQKETRLTVDFREADYRSQMANALNDVESRLDELKKKQVSLLDRVNRTTIQAPESGQVMGLRVNTAGAVLAPGTHILDIVPEGASLLVEARISPNDVDTVALNQAAEVRLTSFKSKTTPVIEGKVIYLAGDRQLDERTGQPYFECRVQLTREGLAMLSEASLRLQPGIPAEVIIKTGERTLMQYIAQPLSSALARVFREK